MPHWKLLAWVELKSNIMQNRCHQWSPRPDPQSHLWWSLFSLEIALLCEILNLWTDGPTTHVKIMITNDCHSGSAEWINTLAKLFINVVILLLTMDNPIYKFTVQKSNHMQWAFNKCNYMLGCNSNCCSLQNRKSHSHVYICGLFFSYMPTTLRTNDAHLSVQKFCIYFPEEKLTNWKWKHIYSGGLY